MTITLPRKGRKSIFVDPQWLSGEFDPKIFLKQNTIQIVGMTMEFKTMLTESAPEDPAKQVPKVEVVRFERGYNEAQLLQHFKSRILSTPGLLWRMLSSQRCGEAGYLPTDGTQTIFYMRGRWWKGVSKIGVSWMTNPAGWYITAVPPLIGAVVAEHTLVVLGNARTE